MNTLVDMFKSMWTGKSAVEKTEVEGYLMMSDFTNKKTLLLIKEGENTWKTRWFNDNENTYKAPEVSIQKIFTKPF